MTDERDDDQGKEGQTAPTEGASKKPEVTPDSAPESPIDELRTKVTRAANEFLKARLGLEEGADGGLSLPNRGVFENIGERADQFVRGFFRGFVEKTPEEREAAAGVRDPKDVPSPTEVVTRLLERVSETMSGTFHEYLKDHVVSPTEPEKQVVVDGRFVLRHGAPLLASFVHALGTRFSAGEGAGGPAGHTTPAPPNEEATSGAPGEDAAAAPTKDEGAAPHESASEAPHVDYRVHLPSVFTSLFVRPPSHEGEKDK
jgi:hypothetical protein